MNYVSTDCGCDSVGTDSGSECDSNGQCNCKTNVESLQCTECREGFWNLTAENVLGCQGKANIGVLIMYMCVHMDVIVCMHVYAHIYIHTWVNNNLKPGGCGFESRLSSLFSMKIEKMALGFVSSPCL